MQLEEAAVFIGILVGLSVIALILVMAPVECSKKDQEVLKNAFLAVSNGLESAKRDLEASKEDLKDAKEDLEAAREGLKAALENLLKFLPVDEHERDTTAQGKQKPTICTIARDLLVVCWDMKLQRFRILRDTQKETHQEEEQSLFQRQKRAEEQLCWGKIESQLVDLEHDDAQTTVIGSQLEAALVEETELHDLTRETSGVTQGNGALEPERKERTPRKWLSRLSLFRFRKPSAVPIFNVTDSAPQDTLQQETVVQE